MPLRSLSGILAEIIAVKQQEVAALQGQLTALEAQAHDRKSPVRPFRDALAATCPAIISEIKKASPSRGVIQPHFHPAFQAARYEEGGASCLSVLTDRQFFQGSLTDLEAARAATQLPVLRKDFVIDRAQIFEAAAHGADAILLIAAVLETDDLRGFREEAEALGLAVLVEVHDAEELSSAVDSGATLIGVNNRDLTTFEISLETSLRLSYLMPSHALRVSESGIFSRADIDTLMGAGYQAFLVGESLMRAANSSASLQELIGKPHPAGGR
jgi:indole-3-glycerol phosphate synthase